MKRVINFHKAYIPTTALSLILIIGGMIGYFINGGFNLGVDFQAGLMQEIQLAPTALEMTYAGKGVASVSMQKTKLDIVVSGSEVEKATHSFAFAEYTTIGSLVDALATVNGLTASAVGDRAASTEWLVQSAQENPQLGANPYALHFLKPGAAPVTIAAVRAAIEPIGSVTVQSLGKPEERRFMVRVEDQGKTEGFAKVATENLSRALETAFGKGEIAVASSNYVGSRFSKDLTDQAGTLVVLTLFLILVYSAIRFKLQYAIGAVLAIAHDALIMVAFIAFTRMEFNTNTIAAILTILGYSINDTIVIFDRIRECVRLYPDDTFRHNMNRAITETLSRTIITSFATMLAVGALFLFTTGDMKDFALVLLVGMTSGVYSTIYIASAFIDLWNTIVSKRRSKAPKTPVAAPQKA
jgi:preprotein translocase subunit SecF